MESWFWKDVHYGVVALVLSGDCRWGEIRSSRGATDQ